MTQSVKRYLIRRTPQQGSARTAGWACSAHRMMGHWGRFGRFPVRGSDREGWGRRGRYRADGPSSGRTGGPASDGGARWDVALRGYARLTLKTLHRSVFRARLFRGYARSTLKTLRWSVFRARLTPHTAARSRPALRPAAGWSRRAPRSAGRSPRGCARAAP